MYQRILSLHNTCVASVVLLFLYLFKSHGIFWTRPVLAADHLSSILPSCKTICAVFSNDDLYTEMNNAKARGLAKRPNLVLPSIHVGDGAPHCTCGPGKLESECKELLYFSQRGKFRWAFFLVFWDPFGEVGGI